MREHSRAFLLVLLAFVHYNHQKKKHTRKELEQSGCDAPHNLSELANSNEDAVYPLIFYG